MEIIFLFIIKWIDVVSVNYEISFFKFFRRNFKKYLKLDLCKNKDLGFKLIKN